MTTTTKQRTETKTNRLQVTDVMLVECVHIFLLCQPTRFSRQKARSLYAWPQGFSSATKRTF